MRGIIACCVLIWVSAVSVYGHAILVDGDPADWVGIPGSEGTTVISRGEAIYVDYIGDDLGDGGDAPLADDNPEPYSYPTNPLFLGTEADILEWRCTTDISNDMIYFLIRVSYDEPWMPFIGICFDLDHIPGSGQRDCGNYSEVMVAPENAWEFLISIWNMQVTVRDQNWNVVPGATMNYFDTIHDVIEVGVNVSNWVPSPWGMTAYVTVYAGLQDFDNLRNVNYSASEWQGGGGYDDALSYHDPKVYDLCFCTPLQQNSDLSNYTNTSPTVLSATTVYPLNMTMLNIVDDEDEIVVDNISIYPNPFVDGLSLNITNPYPVPVAIEFYDILGHRVLYENLGLTGAGERKISKSNMLPQGIYFYRISAGVKTLSGKIVKLR